MGSVIPLTPARAPIRTGRIAEAVRSDIIDYGNPGWHLHPPMSFTRRSTPRPEQMGSIDQQTDFPPGAEVDLGPGAVEIATGQSALLGCFGSSQQSFSLNRTVGIGATEIHVTDQINRKFAITHIFGNQNDIATTISVHFQIRVSTNSNQDATGDPLFTIIPGTSNGPAAFDGRVESYPQRVFLNPPYFIKFLVFNDSATAVNAMMLADVVYLD